ncbi:Arc family DNA-binding protein [Litchfieldella xinjiangensis]|uniref:Arc family DNA-binding protein n=1 Tax=Litchfieldella xinjiangensis TaxID=1166948 RepID=UPI0005BD8461|nr:Arc family DNA-binding protein [Halomonas xinjiangensis]
MKESDVQLNLRVPTVVRDSIAQAAKKNRRSVTAEVIVRLEESLAREGVNPETGERIDPGEMIRLLGDLASRLALVEDSFEASTKNQK